MSADPSLRPQPQLNDNPCPPTAHRQYLWALGSVSGQAQMDIQLRYTAVFEAAEEGGYIVTFPAIPGLATQGETLDEARVMAADCLRAYLESLRKDGERLPYEAPDGPITERLTVDLASA